MMLNVTTHRGKANQNHHEVSPPPVRMTIIKKMKGEGWPRYGEMRALHCRANGNLCNYYRNDRELPQKVTVRATFDGAAAPFLGGKWGLGETSAGVLR